MCLGHPRLLGCLWWADAVTSCPRTTSCAFVRSHRSTSCPRTTSSPSSPSTRGMFALRMCRQFTPIFAQGHILPKNNNFASVPAHRGTSCPRTTSSPSVTLDWRRHCSLSIYATFFAASLLLSLRLLFGENHLRSYRAI